jgi:hypothetical protein
VWRLPNRVYTSPAHEGYQSAVSGWMSILIRPKVSAMPEIGWNVAPEARVGDCATGAVGQASRTTS